MINSNHRFIFIRTPKSASTAVIGSLMGHHKLPKKYRLNTRGHWDGDPNHYPLSAVREIVPESIYENYFKFGFTRNPWDKMVSQFFYSKKWWGYPVAKRTYKERYHAAKREKLKGELKNFKSYVLSSDKWGNSRWPSPYLKISDYKMMLGCDFIGRFENLQEDFNLACEKIGIIPEKLRQKNKTKHKPYWKYYDDETTARVGELYQEDIKRFGYKFGEL
jgi:hypothetical protein